MLGSLRRRSKGTWLITLEFGYVRDPTTGTSKRIQKYTTFHGTKPQAQDTLTDLLHDATHGTFIEPDKRTVAEWLDEWVELAIKPPRRTPRAYETYRSVIACHLTPALGNRRLQGLRVLDIEAMVAEKSALAPATLDKILTVLGSALKAAERSQLVARNVVALVANRPKSPGGHSVDNCWTAEEAATFIRTATAAGPRQGASMGWRSIPGVANPSWRGSGGRMWIWLRAASWSGSSSSQAGVTRSSCRRKGSGLAPSTSHERRSHSSGLTSANRQR